MNIERKGITSVAERLPIISKVVTHGDVVYLCGGASDPVGPARTGTKHQSR